MLKVHADLKSWLHLLVLILMGIATLVAIYQAASHRTTTTIVTAVVILAMNVMILLSTKIEYRIEYTEEKEDE